MKIGVIYTLWINNMKKSNKELRKFALVMTIAFAIIGSIAFWQGRNGAPYLLYISAFFLVSGGLFPRLLIPIEWAWMKLAHYMSIVMTFIILTLTFYLMIAPLGLMMRLFGKDLLSLKFEPNRKSYWIKVDPDGPASRYDKPY